jgi:hypothetical protein
LDFGVYDLNTIYPEGVQTLYGVPVVIFLDHRWTLPVIFTAGEEGILKLPVRMVTFDRHRDSLAPLKGTAPLEAFRNGKISRDTAALAELVRNHLSPRDDDWILSGMELGLLSDVVQFGSFHETQGTENAITCYRDRTGQDHRIFHLDRPARELSYKGALADPGHEAVKQGLWEILNWQPETGKIRCNKETLLVDIDLDFFTIPWEKYVFPFPSEVYEDEFFTPAQSPYGWSGMKPVDWLRSLVKSAGLSTIACEPDFCGSEGKAEQVLADVNSFLFESRLGMKIFSGES